MGQESGNVQAWASKFENLVGEVMSHVRFPMLSPRQVADLLRSPLITKFPGFFFEKMADAMTFHSRDRGDLIQHLMETPETRLLITPRLYTSETWGALLAIENYPSFPTFGVRTLVFSSPSSMSEAESETPMEWSVDLYPKGVRFKKLYLIALHGTVELPESTVQSVRLSVSSRTKQECRTLIGVLLYGVKDGIEYVRSVVQKNFVFSAEECILNIDSLVPYDDLNGQACSNRYYTISQSSSTPSTYLVGSRNDVFKIHIILLPISVKL